MTRSTILFLGCHCDDIELGCGALVHRLARTHEVHCLTLAHTLAGGRLRDELAVAQSRALRRLGVSRAWTLDLPTCSFPGRRQAVWEALHDAERSLAPDVVFTQYRDRHQDHEALYKETLRNFPGATVMAYRVLPSCPHFRADYFEPAGRADVEAKQEALAHYRTVLGDKPYLRPEVVEAELRLNGAAARAAYAEAFRVVRLRGLFARAWAAAGADDTDPEHPALYGLGRRRTS